MATQAPGATKVERLAPDMGTAVGAKLRRARYWVGTRPDPKPPFHNISIGPVTFPDFENPPMKAADGSDARAYYHGAIVELDEKQVEALKQGCLRMFVRWRSKNRAARTSYGEPHRLVTDEDLEYERKRYGLTEREFIARKSKVEGDRPNPETDEPLSKYVYCVKSDVRGGEIPPSIYDAGIEAP